MNYANFTISDAFSLGYFGTIKTHDMSNDNITRW